METQIRELETDLSTATIPVVSRITGLVASAADRAPFHGKGEMVISSYGFVLTIKHGLFGGNPTVVRLPLSGVRELRNAAATKGYFDFTFLWGKTDISIRLRPMQDIGPALSSWLDSFPDEAYAPICLLCGGAIMGGICNSCGQDPRQRLRARILVGVTMLVGAPALLALIVAMPATSWVGRAAVIPLGLLFVSMTGLWFVVHGMYRLRILSKANRMNEKLSISG